MKKNKYKFIKKNHILSNLFYIIHTNYFTQWKLVIGVPNKLLKKKKKLGMIDMI